jgi:signal recognition particle GTPase
MSEWMHDWQHEEEKSLDIDLIESLGSTMSTSPANFHDWEYERESARDIEISDAISDRMQDLEMSSGHGQDEQKLMGRVLDTLFESDIATETFRRYLFEIWKQRSASTIQDKKKMARASQVIANLLAPILRDIVSSDVHKEFGE